MKDNQKELFVVVDGHDTILGYKTRYECHHDKSLIHRAIEVGIINDKGELLLQKRSMQKDLYPGFYQMSVGGHVEKGEEYLDAAIREVEEEMGLKKVNLKFLDKITVHTSHETEILSIFLCYSNGPFTVAPDETSEINFYTYDKAKQLKLNPHSEKALPLFQKYMR